MDSSLSQLTPTTSIPASLQMLLRDLDFLGQITRGQKPCIRSRVLVSGDSWGGALYRAFKGENRIVVISEIERILGQCVEAINMHKGTDHLKLLVEFGYRAYVGTESLKSTYSDDPDMISRLNVVLRNLDLQLSRYRTYINGYGQTGKANELSLQKVETLSENEEDFPGLNSNTIDLSDSIPNEKIRLRKNRIKKSLEKTM